MTDTIILLSDRDKVRQRPGMYIGDNDKLGLMTIVREVVDNAIDEYPNYSDKSKPIEVILHSDNSVSVRDYGRGISPYKSTSEKTKGQIQERLAYTRIGAGGKFKSNRQANGSKFSGGLNGTGSAATNFMSEFYDVTIWRDGYIFHDRFEGGGNPVIKLDKTGNLPKTKQAKGQNETGTRVHFKADKTAMRVTKIDAKVLENLFQQSVYLNQGLTIRFQNERDGEEDFTDYYSENGLLDYLEELTKDEDGKETSFLIKPFLVSGQYQYIDKEFNEEIDMEANIAIGFSKDNGFATEAFTNGIYNTAGGTHVNGLQAGLLSVLKHYYSEFKTEIDAKNKKEIALIEQTFDVKNVMELVKPRDIARKVYAIIDFKHSDPILQPQTKDRLASKEAKEAVEKIFYDNALLYLDKNLSAIQTIITNFIKELYESAKEKVASIKLDEETERYAISTKLAPARYEDPETSEIFLVEGDSAAGTIKVNKDSDFQALLALRGKVLNTKKATQQKILGNIELTTLIAAIGAGFGDNFDINKIKYGKIIIATDQDVDGLHIRCLLLTFFAEYMPELLFNGHIYFLDTPLFVNEMKGKNVKDHYTYSNEEQREFLEKNKGKIIEVNRNKGLGELEPEQVIETILEKETRKLTQIMVSDTEQIYELIEDLMGDGIQARKRLFTES